MTDFDFETHNSRKKTLTQSSFLGGLRLPRLLRPAVRRLAIRRDCLLPLHLRHRQ